MNTATIATFNGFTTYTIQSKDKRSRMSFVPAKGGAAYSLTMSHDHQERELLYVHDFFWQKELNDFPGGWPFCFPICARLERMGKSGDYLYDGKIYNMPIHGFSWWLPWEVIDHKSNEITLRLRHNEITLAMYPFHFEIILTYKITNNQVTCFQAYINKGNKPMPYASGFHPYFLTPALGNGKEQVQLNYQPIRRFIYNERLTDLIGEAKLFQLPSSIANPELNEQLTQLGDDKHTYLYYPDGMQIEMTAEGVEDPNLFPYIQLYNIPEKPFFCIEPWMSFPNAMNTVQGMRWLSPGKSEHGILQLRLFS